MQNIHLSYSICNIFVFCFLYFWKFITYIPSWFFLYNMKPQRIRSLYLTQQNTLSTEQTMNLGSLAKPSILLS